MNVGDDKAVYAYVRQKGSNKIFVILNLSDKEQTITITDNALLGNPLNVFTGIKELLNTKARKIEPWGYAIYNYDL